jgi:hypothetical protein
MKKPTAKLIGADGNIFNLVGIARNALKKAGQDENASEMSKRVIASKSYEDALNVIADYVKIK